MSSHIISSYKFLAPFFIQLIKFFTTVNIAKHLLVHHIYSAYIRSIIVDFAKIILEIYTSASAVIKLGQLRNQVDMTAALTTFCAVKNFRWHGW